MKMHTNLGELDLEPNPETGNYKAIPQTAPKPAPTSQPPRPPADQQKPEGPRYRSKTEARYAGHLEALRKTGQIREWRYEAFRVKLAENTTITADFWVVLPNHLVEIHEVKGEFCREDGWIKLKIAAALWPWFRWYKIEWRQGEWHSTRVPSR